MSMALNLQYDAIGKSFVQQYYMLFDDPNQRPNLVNMYNNLEAMQEIRFINFRKEHNLKYHPVEHSFMTFEGKQLQGSVKIMEKLNSLGFTNITRQLTEVDSQPMFDGGVLINVLGRLQVDNDPPHAYTQVFVLKPLNGSFFVQHDIFRLNIHNSA